MYDAIRAQPSAFTDAVNNNQEQIEKLKKLFSAANKVFLVGTGTSYHAAWTSNFILKPKYTDKIILSCTAFDFALYNQNIQPEDVVVIFSHRGTKKYSLQSLEKAKAAGAKSVLVTGMGGGRQDIADIVIETVEQEKSSAHTVSYVTAVAIIAGVAEVSIDDLSSTLHQGLLQEDVMKKEVDKLNNARKIWIVGGGPNEVVAKEVALKIKETSYAMTEGVGVEELFHGPFQSADPDDAFILLAPDGEAKGRVMELIPAIQEIGSSFLLIDGGDFKQVLKEEYTPLQCLLPLQLLTYYLAIAKGTNPDSFRLNDPRFARAEKYMKL